MTQEHYTPKGSDESIKTYLLARSSEEIYEWINIAKERLSILLIERRYL